MRAWRSADEEEMGVQRRLKRCGLWWRKRPVVDEIAETWMRFGVRVRDEIMKIPLKNIGI